MITLNKDRQFFLKSLCTSPFFLLRHLPNLTSAVARKVNNWVRVKFSAKHYGAKRSPGWISKKVNTPTRCYENSSFRFILACYPIAGAANFAKFPPMLEKADDPEAYFSMNRWGFLLESLLVNSSARQSDLAKISAWIKSYTDKGEVAWEIYSACERISNLLVYLAANAASAESSEFQKTAAPFVADSAEWIRRHVEYYGPTATNNHIINNARALVLAGVAIDNDSIYEAGVSTFRKCLPAMVGNGGFLRERSSHYQLIVTNWVLDAWRFAAARYGVNHPDATYLKDYGARMTSAAAMLCDGDSRLLGLIGDISPDTSPLYSTLRLSRLYPEFWPVTNKNHQSAEMKDDWFLISRENQYVLGNFPAGLFPDPYPTHGHCDHTSFIWQSEGVEILVDTGRYRYTPDDVSLLQISAAGHNVPFANGYSPLCESLLKSGLWWPKPYAVAKLESSASNGAVLLSHDGFSRMSNITRHTREINLMSGGLEVVDSFEGKGQVNIRLRWNFGTSFNFFESDLMSVMGYGGTVEFITKGFAEPPLIFSSSSQSDGGWISAVYGKLEPSIYVDVSSDVTLPVVISTRFKFEKCAA